MATRKITIEVSEEVARAYKNASPEKRKRAQPAGGLFVNVWLEGGERT